MEFFILAKCWGTRHVTFKDNPAWTFRKMPHKMPSGRSYHLWSHPSSKISPEKGHRGLGGGSPDPKREGSIPSDLPKESRMKEIKGSSQGHGHNSCQPAPSPACPGPTFKLNQQPTSLTWGSQQRQIWGKGSISGLWLGRVCGNYRELWVVKEAQGPCPGLEGGWGMEFGETHRATRNQGELGPDNCFWGLERGAALWTMGHGQRQANLPSHLSLSKLGQVSGFPADYQRETSATHTFTHIHTDTYTHTKEASVPANANTPNLHRGR